jgi:hypothetical protein
MVEAEYKRAIDAVNAAPPPSFSSTPATPSSGGELEHEPERKQLKQARRRRKQRRRAIETKRREARERIEQALTQQLAALGRDQFDAQRLQASVQASSTHYGEPRFLRSFYFDEMIAAHMRNFARKYAHDLAYRAEVDGGATAWARRDALFERNLFTIALRRLSSAELEAVQTDLWRWIKRHAAAVLALPEYARLQEIDSACAPSMNEVDPEIRAAVAAWNAIPGVVTRFSCQGVSGAVAYEGRQILAVTPHEEVAYVEFSAMPASVVGATLELALEHPVIQVIETSATNLGKERHQGRSVLRLQSAFSNGNVAFRLACAELAAQVRLQLGH